MRSGQVSPLPATKRSKGSTRSFAPLCAQGCHSPALSAQFDNLAPGLEFRNDARELSSTRLQQHLLQPSDGPSGTSHSLQHQVVRLVCRILNCCQNVVTFKIGIVLQNLLVRRPSAAELDSADSGRRHHPRAQDFVFAERLKRGIGNGNDGQRVTQRVECLGAVAFAAIGPEVVFHHRAPTRKCARIDKSRTISPGGIGPRRAYLGTTAEAGSHANRNAGFIRQAGEWHWGCRMNPAFRWWCQEAPGQDGTTTVSGWRGARNWAPPSVSKATQSWSLALQVHKGGGPALPPTWGLPRA